MHIISEPGLGAVVLVFDDAEDKATVIEHLQGMDDDHLLYCIFPDEAPKPDDVEAFLERIKKATAQLRLGLDNEEGAR